MKKFLNQLFDYNYYCNKRFIEHCAAMDKVPETSLRLFSHVLNAHHIWNSRIAGRKAELGVWDIHPLSRWEELHYDNQRASFGVITNTNDFSEPIPYETTEGNTYSSSLQDILFHIINHSTHHRAQIAADFRVHSLVPLEFDYIHYKRQ